MEMKKVEVKMNKLVYLGQAILDISKMLMYEFWYNYIKPKYGNNAKLCYMDTDSFIISIKTEDFCKDISNDVENWFDTSNYNENDKRPLPIGENEKVIGIFNNGLDRKIMTEFVALVAKTYAYLIDGYNDDDYDKNKIINKKAKGTKKCVIKRRLMFEKFRVSLFNNKKRMQTQMRFKSGHHEMITEEINKIALHCNDDKRLYTFDRITRYPRGANAFKVCESEMLVKK